MKKTRFIPYGYTMRNGYTVIEHGEADIIRYIFDVYIKGASLKDIAEELTKKKIPYTEKTDVWDKARIARIIENACYIGENGYDPIITEEAFDEAGATKIARQRGSAAGECAGIKLIRHRVKCAKCGSPMIRRVTAKLKVQEAWICSNDECGCRLRISDSELLSRISLLMNRIILNSKLMIPKCKKPHTISPAVAKLEGEIAEELQQDDPSEAHIISCITDIASQLYRETNTKDMIAAQIARKKVMLMSPQDNFNCDYFSDLIEFVLLDSTGQVSLRTKTNTLIKEASHGCSTNPKADSHSD